MSTPSSATSPRELLNPILTARHQSTQYVTSQIAFGRLQIIHAENLEDLCFAVDLNWLTPRPCQFKRKMDSSIVRAALGLSSY